MNYIILNGKKSTMVKGLMIQSLPPITKPLMRSRIEEIDGRDGDIVTKLGYSAYDKEMSIGLFGDYDISEVIDFFNSEGEVIFSNELERKYQYKILNQIDFEKLGIFREARVSFHVQPFKYPSFDDSLTIEDGASVTKSANLVNHGNIYAKPVIFVYGCPPTSFTMTINGQTISISRGYTDPSDIMIDVEKMNAYFLTNGNYANRKVIADYSKIKLKAYDNNTLTWTGTCTRIVIKNISRWI